jgi:UDP-N-acetylmuramoyl-tripeptide--D-alanyl-D-alanine ligase
MAYASIPAVTDATRPGPSLSTAELARITGGRVLAPGDRPIRGGAVDSRLVEPGVLFIALAGERTDGHRFLQAAAEAGAAALLVHALPADQTIPAGVGIVAVPEPLAGLHAVAAAWRRRFSPLTVGITGSIAKTSTKDAVAAVMAARYETLRSEGNQNNEVGLPLTILRLGPEHGPPSSRWACTSGARSRSWRPSPGRGSGS